jgi:VCBS repeat-containing protein
MADLPGTQNRIRGTKDSEVLVGTIADDMITSFGGQDEIDGGVSGDDYLDGGAGNDILVGGSGDDWLIGGTGSDEVTGGAGADQFRFRMEHAAGQPVDTITDLNFAEGDLINLAPFPGGLFAGDDIPGQLEIGNPGTGQGGGATIQGWAGLAALVAQNAFITAAREGQTDHLVLTVSAPSGTQVIRILNGWPDYSAQINQPPTANDDIVAVDEDAAASGNVLANDADPDAGDTLTLTTVAGQAVPGAGDLVIEGLYGTLTIRADGGYSYVASKAATQALGAGAPASESFSYTIADGSGETATAALTFNITGVNDGPVAQGETRSLLEDGSVDGNLLANDSDIDAGDVLKIASAKGAGSDVALPGDGSSIAVQGAYGTLNLSSDGSYSYAAGNGAAQALAPGQPATDTFSYVVSDASGATSTVTLTLNITGVNDGPVAQNLNGSVLEDGGAISFAPLFADPDAGDTHSYALGTQGTVGLVTLNSDGTFGYDPNGKFNSLANGQTATDSFTYTVTDAQGASDTKTVSVTIIGQNDLASTKRDIAGVEKNGSISVAANKGVLANDTDVDGDTLSVSAVNGQPGSVGSGVAGKFGTLTMKADGSYAYAANTSPGALPAKGIAQDTFSYTVSDGQGGFKAETLTVTVYQKGQTYKGGTEGADSFVGGNGADVLDGGNGNDILSGGNGADFLIGGAGNDRLTGGSGVDTFVFGGAFGADLVTDFAKGDKIQLSKAEFANFAALAGKQQMVGGNLVIDLGDGNSITLQGVGIPLAASDFLFL